MRICAAVCYWREPSGFIDRCVRSLAGIADYLLAVDGAWENFPDAFPVGTRAEHNWIYDAARAVGLPVMVDTPGEVWKSQVAKRNAMMRTAAILGDWILVIDGDEYISDADPAALRAGLAHTDAIVGEITLKQPEGIAGGLTRRLYRAGTTVEIVHTGYTYQGRHLLPGEPTVDLTDCLTITHDYRARGDVRNAQSDEYIRRRAETREETWVSA